MVPFAPHLLVFEHATPSKANRNTDCDKRAARLSRAHGDWISEEIIRMKRHNWFYLLSA